MKIHVYSDLWLRYLDFADPVDEQCPSVDLVVTAGNISNDIKRSLLFQETIAKQQTRPMAVNLGKFELSRGEQYIDAVDAMELRYRTLENTNCYFKVSGSVFIPQVNADILQLRGFPKFDSEQKLKETTWSKFFWGVRMSNMYDEKGTLVSYLKHDTITLEQINLLHDQEQYKLLDWLSRKDAGNKILIWGNDDVQLLNSYDLTGVTIIAVGDAYEDREFNQGRLYRNPGSGSEARSRILEI